MPASESKGSASLILAMSIGFITLFASIILLRHRPLEHILIAGITSMALIIISTSLLWRMLLDSNIELPVDCQPEENDEYEIKENEEDAASIPMTASSDMPNMQELGLEK